MEAAAKEFAGGPSASEELVLRCVLRYFDRAGTELEIARRTRENTLNLLLKDLRRVMRASYEKDARSPEDAVRRQRRLNNMTTKVKKVFLDRELDAGEVLLAAGLNRDRTGKLVDVLPARGLFGRLYKDAREHARARGSDGRHKRGAAKVRKLSPDGVLEDLDTLASVDPDGLWDKLVPWLKGHDFRVIDLQAAHQKDQG